MNTSAIPRYTLARLYTHVYIQLTIRGSHCYWGSSRYVSLAFSVLEGCAEEAEERQKSQDCKAERKHRI